MAVAVGVSVQQPREVVKQARSTTLNDLPAFRRAFYDSLTLRANAFVRTHRCAAVRRRAVSTLAGLTLTAEHRHGHGALLDGLGSGRIQFDRLRRSLARLPVPRDALGGSPWRWMSARGYARTRSPARIGPSTTSTGAAKARHT